VFDRDRNDFRIQPPNNTAVIRDYYAFTDPEGATSVEVEKTLAVLEGETKPVLDKLDQRVALTTPERESLAMFIALLETRTPDFERGVTELVTAVSKGIARTAFADPTRARSSLENFERSTGKTPSVSAEEMVTFVRSEAYTVHVDPRLRLAMMMKLAVDIAPLLLGLEWTILHAPLKSSFITTDSPFIVIPKSGTTGPFGAGILTPGAMKFVPLGTGLGILITEPGDSTTHGEPSRDVVRQLNLNVAVRADGYVFARDERLLRSLVERAKLQTSPRLSKVQVG
jgi:hypothetical protein